MSFFFAKNKTPGFLLLENQKFYFEIKYINIYSGCSELVWFIPSSGGCCVVEGNIRELKEGRRWRVEEHYWAVLTVCDHIMGKKYTTPSQWWSAGMLVQTWHWSEAPWVSESINQSDNVSSSWCCLRANEIILDVHVCETLSPNRGSISMLFIVLASELVIQI